MNETEKNERNEAARAKALARKIARLISTSAHDESHDKDVEPTSGNISRGGERHPENYETWAVGLWLANEEPAYRMARGCVESAIEEAIQDLIEDENAPVAILIVAGDAIKAEVEAYAPALSGLYADLLNAALGEVDWRRVARGFAEDRQELGVRIEREVFELLS